MKMKELKAGEIAIIITTKEEHDRWKGTIVVRCSNDQKRYQMVGEADGFMQNDTTDDFEIINITDIITNARKEIINAPK